MILSRSASAIETREPVVVDGDTYFKSDWLDSGRDAGFSPSTFLVEQPPNVSLRTHFHRNDQFQLFVRGEGSIGRHPIASVMVHFATAYSAYGPIVAGPTGLAWMTLRTAWESGSLTMKDHGEQMRRVPKRQFHSRTIDVLGADALASLGARTDEVLIPLQPDGLVARVVALPPGAVAERVEANGSSGQYRVVVAGAALAGERRLASWEHCYVADGESAALVADAAGAQVVILQFPRKIDAAGP